MTWREQRGLDRSRTRALLALTAAVAIGGLTSIQMLSSADAAPRRDICSALGDDRPEAEWNYAQNCSAKRVDCDPIDGGEICANVWLKNGRLPKRAPSPFPAPPAPGETTTAPTTTGVAPAPETSAEVVTTTSGASTTASAVEPDGTETTAPTTDAPPTTPATPTTVAVPSSTETTKVTSGGGYSGVGLEPSLPDGLYPGWKGWSDLRIVPAKIDTRKGGPNVATVRIECRYSHMNFDDAIVSPGRPGAAHLHVYFGNTDVDAFTDPMDVGSSGNSTCAGGIANRSAYWVPAVLDANNGNQPLMPDMGVIAYTSGWDGEKPEQVVAPPTGLRIVAGDAGNSDPLPEKHWQRNIQWGCGKKGFVRNTGYTGHIPNSCKPGDLLLMRVTFPACWDGKNLDSADHKSHMAYVGGSPQNRKDCPTSHPVLIPTITINAYYRLNSTDTSGLRLSSDTYDAGKPGGLSAHGDWIVGWEPQVIERILDGCFRPADDCGYNSFHDGTGLEDPRNG